MSSESDNYQGRQLPGTPENMSFPWADRNTGRHEACESRSSVTSNISSVPGMTDSSDSEVSIDDESHYNPSTASDLLWDSFWPSPDNGDGGKDQYPAVLRPSRAPAYFGINVLQTHRQSETDDETTTISPSAPSSPAKSSPSRASRPRTPASHVERPKTPVSYSIYPKPQPPAALPTRITQLPPRVSSLEPEHSTPHPRGRTLKSSKSSHNLTLGPSALKRSGDITPPLPSAATIPTAHAATCKVPTEPKPLRTTKSAFNLRDRSRKLGHQAQKLSQHNVTAPLTPLVGASKRDKMSSPPRSRLEPQVSVFDFDSDAESVVETQDSGLKRLARGLQHKKKASEERQRPATPAAGWDIFSPPETRDKEKEKRSFGRSRGGSLARILGLRSQ